MKSAYQALYPAGSVIIQRPIYQLLWCIKNGAWPRWISLAQAVLSLLIALLQGGQHGSHVLLYVGEGQFVHTTLGKVVLWHISDFPPGYLESSLILKPTNDTAWKMNKIDTLKENWVGAPVSIPAFFCTAFIRWGLMPPSTTTARLNNCTHLVYLLWLENTGRNLAKEIGVDPKGIFPVDFLKIPKEFTLVDNKFN
jgi:hypothetical protein